MNTIILKIIGSGLLFLLVFLSGFWLSRAGKPFPVIVFTIHKLIALGFVIFLAVMVYRVFQSAPPHTAQIMAAGITFLCFTVTIITGGLLSVEKVFPPIILQIHQTFPYLTVLSVGVTLYLTLIQTGLLSPA